MSFAPPATARMPAANSVKARSLGEEPPGSRPLDGFSGSGIGVHRHDQSLVGLGEATQDLHPVEAGHIEVDEDHIRRLGRQLFEQALAVGRHDNYPHVRLGVEGIAETLSEELVIVADRNAYQEVPQLTLTDVPASPETIERSRPARADAFLHAHQAEMTGEIAAEIEAPSVVYHREYAAIEVGQSLNGNHCCSGMAGGIPDGLGQNPDHVTKDTRAWRPLLLKRHLQQSRSLPRSEGVGQVSSQRARWFGSQISHRRPDIIDQLGNVVSQRLHVSGKSWLRSMRH